MQARTGKVIATFSRRMTLELDDGKIVEARIKGKKLRPVCGDVVVTEPIPAESDWLITAITDRHNALSRPNLRGEPEVLAANVDQLVVTLAPLPAPDWFIADRYLAAAESMRAGAIVVFNKLDLLDNDIPAELDVYAEIGYAVIPTSAVNNIGLDSLIAHLDGKVSIFVGQSGVGKSSMINRLLGTDAQKIAPISSKLEEGKHTTVNSRLLPLRNGGAVIDSPGVRDFAPSVPDAAEVASGFVEIEAAAAGCRFSNCRHLQEPGCAVKAAVEDGGISERRLESYRRLLRLTEKFTEKRF